MNQNSNFDENKNLKFDADIVKEAEIDADALMAEFDKESNTRHFTGWRKNVMSTLLIIFTAYVFLITVKIPYGFLSNIGLSDGVVKFIQTVTLPPEQVRRASFLGLLIFIGILLYPTYKKQSGKINYIPFYDVILATVGFCCYFYYVFNFDAITRRAINNTTVDIVVAVVGILILIEACRRIVGLPIIFVAGAFIAYAFIQGYSLKRLTNVLFYTTDGIIGTPLGVCSTFIVLFIILGSFLEKTGIGTFFIDLANSVAGYASGGPAKVAVISSALEGMYSGSSVANTVGSGSVTIPIMKKTGYKPEFAAAVEAAASTGGQIMPPIMGAAAFLMAEYTAVPYATIAVAAILPAVLYFAGIFMMIHFEAKKLGLKGLPKESIPNFFKLILKKGYLFLPIFVLVTFMGNGFTAAMSALWAIVSAIVVSFFRKETRLSFKSFAQALENGAKNTIGVTIACSMSGIIIGVVTLTGLGQTLIGVLVPIAENSLLLALFLVMISCIVLGMGVPTTANYVIMATITAPILIKMGVPVLAAHMYVFYFGIVADITPPVALAAYAGSAIAKSDPLKTGVNATRLAITAFIVPYIFVLSPSMLFIDVKSVFEVVGIIVTSCLGIFGVSAGMERYMFKKMALWESILIIAGGILLVYPGIETDIVGIVLISVITAYQYLGKKKAAERNND